MNINQLRGCGTAIVTPFNQDESIDELALLRLVEFQITNGVDFIVACGTTGESVTMSEEEQARVVELCVQSAKGRVPIVAGAGGYNTREIIKKIQHLHRLSEPMRFCRLCRITTSRRRKAFINIFVRFLKRASCRLFFTTSPDAVS